MSPSAIYTERKKRRKYRTKKHFGSPAETPLRTTTASSALQIEKQKPGPNSTKSVVICQYDCLSRTHYEQQHCRRLVLGIQFGSDFIRSKIKLEQQPEKKQKKKISHSQCFVHIACNCVCVCVFVNYLVYENPVEEVKKIVVALRFLFV